MEKRLKPYAEFQYYYFAEGIAPQKIPRSRLLKWLEHMHDQPEKVVCRFEKGALKTGMTGTISLLSGFVEIKFVGKEKG